MVITRLRTTALVLLPLLALAQAAFVYVTAPVERLRGAVSYTPPGKSAPPRQAGLGVPGQVRLEEMPIDLILATLAAEDAYFSSHAGFCLKCTLLSIKKFLDGTRPQLGGNSTLTQQLMKNVFTGDARHLARKYRELIYALKTERRFSKNDIFTLYANMAETGPGLYGYGAAARFYFGKEVAELTPLESVFIVSLLPSPRRLSQWFRDGAHDARAFARLTDLLKRTLVLKAKLTAQGLLSGPGYKSRLFAAIAASDPRLLEGGKWLREFYDGCLRGKIDPARCLSTEGYDAIFAAADAEAAAFIRKHTALPAAKTPPPAHGRPRPPWPPRPKTRGENL